MLNCAYFVVGVPRSGTSCVSGILHHLGVRMTLTEFVPATPANELGFFEDLEFSGVLSQFDMPCNNGTLLNNYKKVCFFKNREIAICKAVERRCKENIAWGLKTMFCSSHIPAMIDSCSMPVKLIKTNRLIENSICSAVSAFNESFEKVTASIKEFQFHINRSLNQINVPVLEINYDELIDNPSSNIKKISDFVGTTSNQNVIDFVQPSLRHFK